MKPTKLLFLGLAALTAGTPSVPAPEIFTYPNELSAGPVNAQFHVTPDTAYLPLDHPRVSPRPNQTSFDWWWFSAYNPANLNESLVVKFYLATNASFPLRATTTDAVSVDVFVGFADGSAAPVMIEAKPADFTPKGQAVVNVEPRPAGGRVAGDWQTTGLTFREVDDGFEVRVDAGWMGLTGSMKLKTLAPPRLPCTASTHQPNAPLSMLPHVGWINTVPDASASVSLALNTRSTNKQLNFSSGIGYHDQKWGDAPFHSSVRSWYWGTARFGPYSLVYLQSTSHSDTTYSSVHLARDGREVFTKCQEDSRAPEGDCDALQVLSNEERTTLRIAMGDCSDLLVSIEKTRELVEYGSVGRWTGVLEAIVAEEVKFEGTAMMQEFHF